MFYLSSHISGLLSGFAARRLIIGQAQISAGLLCLSWIMDVAKLAAAFVLLFVLANLALILLFHGHSAIHLLP